MVIPYQTAKFKSANILAIAMLNRQIFFYANISGYMVYYDRQFNIYKHSAPSEASATIPLLTSLMERIKELLKKWPDHPLLNQACFSS